MKVTIGIDNHSSLIVRVKEDPLAFDAYEQVNTYHIEKFYGTVYKQTAFLEEMLTAMKGEGWYCNDDPMTDTLTVLTILIFILVSGTKHIQTAA